MWASGQILDEEARKEAKDRADGVVKIGLSPAALKRRLAAKKAAQKAAKKQGAA